MKQLNEYKVVHISGTLVERYNQALESLGIKKTNLTSFTIDLMGWSPEIAIEKNDDTYLSYDNNLPYGIIMSPEQIECDVLYRYYSFDKDIMYALFQAYDEQIRSMSIWTSLIVTIDLGVESVSSPYEFFEWNQIVVECSVPYFIKKAKREQDALIEEFYQGDNSLSEEMHTKLLESAQKNGDLREKVLDLDPITISPTVFYTKSYGGVYVLKKPFLQNAIIFSDKKVYTKYGDYGPDKVFVLYIFDDSLIQKLRDFLFIKVSMTDEKLQLLSDVHFADTIAADVDDLLLVDILHNTAMKQKYHVEYNLEVCSYYKDIKNQYQKITKEKLAHLLNEYNLIEELCEPNNLLPAEREVMWHLLTTKSWYNIPMLYENNTLYFWSLYEKWPPAMQVWVNTILK